MKAREIMSPTVDSIDALTTIFDAAPSISIEQEEPGLVVIGPHQLGGLLTVPAGAKGLVIFALGSGDGRFSPRNNFVARQLQERGLATLLLDLLSDQEKTDRANLFDIDLLASRVIEAAEWAHAQAELADLPIGYFGASTGGGAALAAAAMDPEIVSAVVSRSGQPDLAGAALGLVRAPTLLLVGGRDPQVLDLNRRAMDRMKCVIELIAVPGAGHLFEESGALDFVARRAAQWFEQRLAMMAPVTAGRIRLPFSNRPEAGRMLARQLMKFRGSNPLILALPRGGVSVAYEVAKSLNGELDLLLVCELGAPHHSEFGIGAIVDGDMPQIIVNHQVLRTMGIPTGYICNEAHTQLRELERQRQAYLAGRPPILVEGRTVIIVDDGIASGGTVRAALRAIRQKKPARLVLAAPVGALDSVRSLAAECDEVVCVATPQPFCAVGAHYQDFTQISDEEVKRLLGEARAPVAQSA